MDVRTAFPIISPLADVPNMITFLGACCAMGAIVATFHGEFNLAIALIVWAHVADSFDGWAARSQPNRSEFTRNIGKQMDSHADLLIGGAFPLIFLITISGGEIWAILTGMALCSAGLLRLSYFNATSTSEGVFTGLPLPHNVLFFSLVFLSFEIGNFNGLPIALSLSAALLSLAHVSAIRFPKMTELAIWLSVGWAIMLTLLWIISSGLLSGGNIG